MTTSLRPNTAKLLARLIKPLVDEGVILVSEEQIINSNLKYLATKGELMPAVVPKLINQQEAADMLGLAYSNFKKLEREGVFPFQRKTIGSSVRYRNIDVIKFIMADNTEL